MYNVSIMVHPSGGLLNNRYLVLYYANISSMRQTKP